MKRKILINALGYDRSSGGYQTYFENVIVPLLRNYSHSGLKYLVLLSPLTSAKFEVIKKETIIASPRLGLSRVLWEIFFLKKVLEKNEIDIVYTPYQVGYMGSRSCISILMLRNMEPFVASNYSYPFLTRLRSALLKHLTKYCLNRVDHVIAISKFTSKYATEKLGVDPKKIITIPHGVQQDGRLGGPIKKVENVIFTAGTLGPYRRIEDLLIAMPLVLAEFPNTKLFIAGKLGGENFMNGLLNLIHQKKLVENVCFMGRIEKEKMKEMFSTADLFVMTSEIEACPNIALEAMGWGCPIVSSNNEPMPEFFENGALYYSKRNSNELADRMINILKDENLRMKLSKLAKERSSMYTWEKTLSATNQLFREK